MLSDGWSHLSLGSFFAHLHHSIVGRRLNYPDERMSSCMLEKKMGSSDEKVLNDFLQKAFDHLNLVNRLIRIDARNADTRMK